MTIGRAIATVLGCTLLVAAIGAGVGYGVGAYAPGYYRAAFRAGRDPGFDPVGVGVGSGLTQGTAGGVVTGLVVVALLCWREVRLSRGTAPPPPATATPGVTARRVMLVTGSVLGLTSCLLSGAVLGLLGGVRNAYHRRFLEERELVAPILSADPEFAGVELNEESSGGIYLTGEVPTGVELDRLRDQVTRAVGEARARGVMMAVRERR